MENQKTWIQKEVTNIRESNENILVEFNYGYERDGFSKAHFSLIREGHHGYIIRKIDGKAILSW